MGGDGKSATTLGAEQHTSHSGRCQQRPPSQEGHEHFSLTSKKWRTVKTQSEKRVYKEWIEKQSGKKTRNSGLLFPNRIKEARMPAHEKHPSKETSRWEAGGKEAV